MLATGQKIDKLTERTIKKKGLKILLDDNKGDTEAGVTRGHTANQISSTTSIYRNIDAPAVSAFIVFQYQESKVRCMQDYEKYSKFPHNLHYPAKLMFRGRRLRVTPAVEPDQIVWENLEKSWGEKVYLRLRTYLIVLVLVLVCFFVILQASIFKTQFADNIPSEDLCQGIIPELYANRSSEINVNKLVFDRPQGSTAEKRDEECQKYIADSFYLEYRIDGSSDDVITYDFSACEPQGQDDDEESVLCPSPSQTAFCPCVTTSSTFSCRSLECYVNTVDGDDDELDPEDCTKFEAGEIGQCFCYNSLSDIISNKGVVETMDNIEQNREEQSCKAFFKDYSLSVGLTYLSVLTTAGVNFALRQLLVKLSKQEAHTTTDAEQGSIMSKVFFSNYVTMSIIVLIVYGTTENNPAFFKSLRIFEGPYPDFNRQWYGNIGFYLMTTFILQSFSPLFSKLFFYYIGKPFLRFWHHKRVK